MRFYFNGDSNVEGTELADPSQGMAGVIARHYGAAMINDALAGASNDRIYDTTLQYLRDNPKPDFVMIGWSEHGRESWYFDGQFHEVNNLGVGETLPEQMQRRYRIWQNDIRINSDWHRVMGIYWHNKIYNLHTLMRERGIPHYFFQAFFGFHRAEDIRLDWHGNFFHPYDNNMAYVNWCQAQGYPEITPGQFHFREDAQAAWAQTLINEIGRNQIL